jgi:hypothetical protein
MVLILIQMSSCEYPREIKCLALKCLPVREIRLNIISDYFLKFQYSTSSKSYEIDCEQSFADLYVFHAIISILTNMCRPRSGSGTGSSVGK